MKGMIRLAGIAALGAVLFAALSACGDAAPQAAASHGVVTAVDASARTITLDHKDIPGVMTAMTMTFDVAPDVTLEGIEPGAQVDFSVKQDASGITITELHRAP